MLIHHILTDKLISLLKSIFIWLLIVYLYFIFRFMGNSENIVWAQTTKDFSLVGLISGIILGFSFWGTNIIIDLTGIKRRSYLIIILTDLIVILIQTSLVIFFISIILIEVEELTLKQLFPYFIQWMGEKGVLSFAIYLSFGFIYLCTFRTNSSTSGTPPW